MVISGSSSSYSPHALPFCTSGGNVANTNLSLDPFLSVSSSRVSAGSSLKAHPQGLELLGDAQAIHTLKELMSPAVLDKDQKKATAQLRCYIQQALQSQGVTRQQLNSLPLRSIIQKALKDVPSEWRPWLSSHISCIEDQESSDSETRTFYLAVLKTFESLSHRFFGKAQTTPPDICQAIEKCVVQLLTQISARPHLLVKDKLFVEYIAAIAYPNLSGEVALAAWKCIKSVFNLLGKSSLLEEAKLFSARDFDYIRYLISSWARVDWWQNKFGVGVAIDALHYLGSFIDVAHSNPRLMVEVLMPSLKEIITSTRCTEVACVGLDYFKQIFLLVKEDPNTFLAAINLLVHMADNAYLPECGSAAALLLAQQDLRSFALKQRHWTELASLKSDVALKDNLTGSRQADLERLSLLRYPQRVLLGDQYHQVSLGIDPRYINSYVEKRLPLEESLPEEKRLQIIKDRNLLVYAVLAALDSQSQDMQVIAKAAQRKDAYALSLLVELSHSFNEPIATAASGYIAGIRSKDLRLQL